MSMNVPICTNAIPWSLWDLWYLTICEPCVWHTFLLWTFRPVASLDPGKAIRTIRCVVKICKDGNVSGHARPKREGHTDPDSSAADQTKAASQAALAKAMAQMAAMAAMGMIGSKSVEMSCFVSFLSLESVSLVSFDAPGHIGAGQLGHVLYTQLVTSPWENVQL